MTSITPSSPQPSVSITQNILRRQDAVVAPGPGTRLGDLGGHPAMSIFRQESLSDEVNRESANLTTVAGGGMALQFKTSISSTTSSSTQTSSETVVHRMSGISVQTSGNGHEAVCSAGIHASSPEYLLQHPHQTYQTHQPTTQTTQPPHSVQQPHPIQQTHPLQQNHTIQSQPHTALHPLPDWTTGGPPEQKDNMAVYEGEMRKKDQLIEELMKLHPSHGLNKVRVGEAEEALRSDLAGMTVKVERLEQQVRDCGASVASKDSRLTELTRQLDAHRQEHARQAATIITLRQKLQEEESATVSLRANQRRGEFTVGALTRENRQQADRINDLENRLRTHLEERESAEQRSETAQKRLVELVRVVTSCLSLGDLDPRDAHEKLSTKLAELVQECARLRSEVVRTSEALEQQEGEAGAARQTVSRLVNELDDEKRTVEEQKIALEEYRKEVDDLKNKQRAMEEEVKSVRERLHNTNKSYNTTLEELHTVERQLQRAKDEVVVTEHRRQQTEVEGRGFLTTVATLLSSPDNRIAPDLQAVTDSIQGLVASNREEAEHVERLTSQVTSLGEQSRRHTELYETAVKRGRQSDADLHALATRCRQLEADQAAAEASREGVMIQKEKVERTLGRVVEALGLAEMGHEVTNDVEMIVCRCHQLSKLEGEKIVDKTTTVYQLQRKVKGLREAVERKDLHVDMLRRKLALTEDAARASRHLEEERDEILTKYKRQCRMMERLNGEVAETRLQLRDLKAQMTQAGEDKARLNQVQKKVDEMTTKIDELDVIRSRQQKKISHLKEQVKAQGEHVLEERRLNENSMEGVTQELALTKQNLRDITRRDKQLTEFRRTVVELLGMEGEAGPDGDYEAVCRLERVVGAHKELTDLSRRLDEITAPSRPSRLSPDQSFLDLSEELRALADDTNNQRPIPSRNSATTTTHLGITHTHRCPRPPSAHSSRTPSPTKRPSTDEDEDS
ncbi:hypothetical protein Pmani_002451 [Petrolisthes manimaculis]|uniref:Coiled-coil domain-containing protein 170 n=1 Tax=Petrolisthes manimaculis TaxID=1843537 RepID=A0AAE1UKD6_9EUCA|nr:hypothetical protein Pmani_002451 [Petrolisthes manimaculis]